ncbi:MAG TPA: epimerase [Polyangia bacterium]|jgi:uncharacterized protein YbjT (DUF2867 family)|nr:epimerase [Polyangia bacterium]
MKIILFGATGMVGQGVLRECLLDAEVSDVLSIGRTATGQTHAKLHERLLADPSDLSSIEDELEGYDACFFCLGVTSSGMTEAAYRKIIYDLTIAVANTLGKHNPGLTFIFVTGAGTDSTERGRSMWARVKGQAENALLKMPFIAAYMFRPAIIRPMHGATSKTASYRFFYTVLGPLIPLLRLVFPRSVTTTENIGRAMLVVARRGAPNPIIESAEIDALAKTQAVART